MPLNHLTKVSRDYAAKPAKKTHPADQIDRDAVATAVSFAAFLRRSPTSKILREAATLAEAIAHHDAIIDEVRATGRQGKITPLIYAIQKSGAQSPVPADMIEAARAEIAMQAEAEAKTQPKKRKAVSVAKLAARETAGDERASRALDEVRKAGKRAQAEADAAAGIIPAAPDFSAETHKPYRGKLAQLVELVEAGDIAKLRAFPINPYSSSPKALDRYRNLAVIALKAQKKAAA